MFHCMCNVHIHCSTQYVYDSINNKRKGKNDKPNDGCLNKATAIIQTTCQLSHRCTALHIAHDIYGLEWERENIYSKAIRIRLTMNLQEVYISFVNGANAIYSWAWHYKCHENGFYYFNFYIIAAFFLSLSTRLALVLFSFGSQSVGILWFFYAKGKGLVLMSLVNGEHLLVSELMSELQNNNKTEQSVAEKGKKNPNILIRLIKMYHVSTCSFSACYSIRFFFLSARTEKQANQL